MGRTTTLLLAVFGLFGTEALAQPVADPPALALPMGARVRLKTLPAGDWVKGFLVGANSETITLVPDGAPPLGANQLQLPSRAVTRLELVTGKKRQWVRGLVIGAAVGLAMGFAMDVDPELCSFDDNYFCSRGSAVAAMGATSAGMGALIGAFIRKDAWTPVAIDALGPATARAGASGPTLRAVPGGVALAWSVGF